MQYISSSLCFKEIDRDHGMARELYRHPPRYISVLEPCPSSPQPCHSDQSFSPHFHPQWTAFRLFFLSSQHQLLTQSPSLCVNRIITIHFLQGQISCRPRVCIQLPFPIDNHVYSSVSSPHCGCQPPPPPPHTQACPRPGRTSWVTTVKRRVDYVAMWY
jgi:hypothetical protein